MFLARTDEQRRFEAALGEIAEAPVDTCPSQVLLVHGTGGMGKTELCRRFDGIARGELPEGDGNTRRFFVAMIKWEDERRNHRVLSSDAVVMRPRTVLAALHDTVANHPDLERSWWLRRQAMRAFEPYRRTVAQLTDRRLAEVQPGEALASADGGDLAELPKAILEAGSSAAGLPVSPGDVYGLARAIRDRRSQIDPRLIGTAERAEESLTRELARGLRDLSRHRPVVVILDTYEIIASCGGWVRQAMLATGPRVLWVVAARLEPEEETGGRGDMASFRREIPEENLRLMAMSTFGRKTIEDELHQRGVDDVSDTMLDAVMSLTGGVPLAVSLVAGMLAQSESIEAIGRSVTEKGDTTALVRTLTERYLIHTLEDPSLAGDAPLLLGLALLYADRADSDVLAAIWGDKRDIEATLAELVERHDFVLTDSRRLHQEVRETFRRYQLDGVRRTKWRPANRRAAAIALERAGQVPADLATETRIHNEEWRSAVTTLIWHRFWEGNEAGLETLCEVFPAAVLLQRDFAHELVKLASFFKDTFNRDQESMLRGLASLLSFGGFLGAWAARRHRLLEPATNPDPLASLAPETTSADEQAIFEALRASADRCDVASDTPPGSALVDLLIAKSIARTNTSLALGALTAASNDIPVGAGALAAEIAQTAQDLTVRLVEERDDGDLPAPSAEGMRAGELWAAYADKSPAPSVWFARAHRLRGEVDRALSAYDAVEARLDGLADDESRRTLAEALYGKAVTLEGEESWRPAVDTFDQLIAKLAESGDRTVRWYVGFACFFRAKTLGHLGERDEQLAGYEEVFEEFAADTQPRLRQVAVRAVYEKAVVQQDDGKPDDAVRTLAVLDEHLDERNRDVRLALAEALFLRGVMLAESGERREGIACYSHLAAVFANDVDASFQSVKARAQFNTGFAFDRLNQPDDAIEAYGDLVERFGPGDDPELRRLVVRALSKRAEALIRAGRPVSLDAVVEQIEQIAAMEPVHPETHAFLALFLTDVRGEHDRARIAFERADDGSSDHPNTLANFARLRFEQGEDEDGLTLAERALAAPNSQRDVQLEVHFYLLALGPADRHADALIAIRDLLGKGVRSPDWNLERILDRAERQKRPDMAWLRVLAALINEEESEANLTDWAAWPQD